jgi:hypothetical protein
MPTSISSYTCLPLSPPNRPGLERNRDKTAKHHSRQQQSIASYALLLAIKGFGHSAGYPEKRLKGSKLDCFCFYCSAAGKPISPQTVLIPDALFGVMTQRRYQLIRIMEQRYQYGHELQY